MRSNRKARRFAGFRCSAWPPRSPRSDAEELLRKIQVVSDEEAEEADIVVCCTADMPRYFDDDVFTTCAECGSAIFHRPHAPKKPRKVCIECAARLAEQESAEGN